MKRLFRKLAIIVAVILSGFLSWFWLLPNGGNPRTVGQAVDRLLEELPAEVKEDVAAATEKDMIIYHHSIGMYIRNEFGLWSGNLRLKLSTWSLDALFHSDYASGPIIHALWKELRDRN